MPKFLLLLPIAALLALSCADVASSPPPKSSSGLEEAASSAPPSSSGEEARSQTLSNREPIESKIKKGEFSDAGRFASQPLWTYSGAWTVSGENFIVVDLLGSSLNVYSLSGELVHKATETDFDLEYFEPAFIDSTNDGRYVLDVDHRGTFAWLSADTLEVVGRAQLFRIRNESTGQMIKNLNFWRFCGDEILGFGDIETSEESNTSGYVRIPLSEPSDFEMVKEVGSNAPLRHYYFVGGVRYITSLPEGGCALWLNQSRVLTIKHGEHEVTDAVQLMTGRFDNPGLDWTERTPEPHKFKRLSESRIVTDFIATEDSFYLLIRSPPSWEIERISRKSFRSTGVWAIPTKAKHLVAIPSPEAWILIEKGPVRGVGDQEISSFRVLDSNNL